ncbi:MAG: hypothetical protein ACOCRN_05410 [Spirochaetia bacterium]
MMGHVPGKVFLAAIGGSIIAFFVVAFSGVLEKPLLLFGWMTPPLWLGMGFTVFWLVCYVIYFFFFWPYR